MVWLLGLVVIGGLAHSVLLSAGVPENVLVPGVVSELEAPTGDGDQEFVLRIVHKLGVGVGSFFSVGEME